MTPFVAAVDWGTSSFRLWLMAADGAMLDQSRSGEGMMQAMSLGFPAVLERHLSELGASSGLPAIVCGMAGARQGWREAPYLEVPAKLEDVVGRAVTVTDARGDVRILPGVAQRDAEWPDVMRGEETQLLGLASQGIRSGVVCMPGTHSKWVSLEDGAIARFATFMTGDLYQALVSHTILRLAMEGVPEADPHDPAFLGAVRVAVARPQEAAGRLFSIRAGALLGVREPSEGTAHLSGILIGLELAGAAARFEVLGEVVLVASGHVGVLYESALKAAGTAVRTVDADAAVRAGLLRAAHAIWGSMRDE